MEDWQSLYIKDHFPQLIAQTRCTTDLLARLEATDLLSYDEVDSLNSISVETQKTRLLLRILQTKLKSYEALTKALYQCKQSGAFKILLCGFMKESIPNPFHVCDITPDVSAFLQSEMKFQGRMYKVHNFCLGLENRTLEGILRDCLTPQLYFDLLYGPKNSSKSDFVILNDTLPSQVPYYVSRFVATKKRVDPVVFAKGHDDIFLFKGVDRCHLTTLAGNYLTATSGTQTEAITVRFILLENDADIDVIQRNSNYPVHVIEYHKNYDTYVLAATYGGTSVIGTYLIDSETKFSEDDFIEVLQESKVRGVCLCDNSGMGKTVLLGHLARKLSEENLESIVAFIHLPQFVQTVGQFSRNIESPESLLQLFVSYITPSTLAQRIVIELINDGVRNVELLFDGFDEIPSEYFGWTLKLFSTLVNKFPKIRLFVTSKPHFQTHLENALGAISYNIQPFDEKDQMHFLVKFWKEQIPKANVKGLKEFASMCLQKLKSRMNNGGNDIVGLPLQCYLLAEVYCKDAENFLRTNKSLMRSISNPIRISKMYEKFMSLRFSRASSLEERDIAEKYHILCALKLLFPEISADFLELVKLKDEKINMDFLLSFGILEEHLCENSQALICVSSLYFVHITFAEFIVSRFFSDIIFGNFDFATYDLKYYNRLASFIFDNVFKSEQYGRFRQHSDLCPEITMPIFNVFCFSYPSILYFINGQRYETKGKKLCKTIMGSFYKIMDPICWYNAFQSCIFHGYIELLCFLREAHEEETRCYQLAKFKMYLVDKYRWFRLLLIASDYSNRGALQECFKICKKHVENLEHMSAREVISLATPLHLCVRRGNYDMVEFLLQYFSLNGRGLVYTCAAYSAFDSIEIVRNKEEIIKLLLQNDSALINEIKGGVTPLLAEDVHPDILELLLAKTAEILSTSSFDDIINHLI